MESAAEKCYIFSCLSLSKDLSLKKVLGKSRKAEYGVPVLPTAPFDHYSQSVKHAVAQFAIQLCPIAKVRVNGI
jgi:hypothetical protein